MHVTVFHQGSIHFVGYTVMLRSVWIFQRLAMPHSTHRELSIPLEFKLVTYILGYFTFFFFFLFFWSSTLSFHSLNPSNVWSFNLKEKFTPFQTSHQLIHPWGNYSWSLKIWINVIKYGSWCAISFGKFQSLWFVRDVVFTKIHPFCFL